jgi:hypothetical protein
LAKTVGEYKGDTLERRIEERRGGGRGEERRVNYPQIDPPLLSSWGGG